MVRISSGRLKGRKVVTSRKIFTSTEGDELRPTSSKVREAIFNILQAEIDQSMFLDLYAGTGAVGLEALSRGAERVFFVESNQVRSKAIVDYIKKLDLEARAVVYRETTNAFLKRAVMRGMQFDIIFADPPYISDDFEQALPYVAEHNILKDDGCILVEHSSKKVLPEHIHDIKRIKNYKYGDTMLTLYRKEQ
jgi:16S rRNA (guanine(966)-N(2))-methyltransferase RsmD